MAVQGIEQKTITQVCIVTDDVERISENYRKIMGFTISDNYFVTPENDQSDSMYYGKPASVRVKGSVLNLGKVQFEFLQPLDEPTAWGDQLKKNGESLHHIAISVMGTDNVVKSFNEHGYSVIQQGYFTNRDGRYTYMDTDKDMGIVIEVMENFAGLPNFQSPPFPADKGIGTDIICQVGVIVNDIEKTGQRISDVLGVPKPPTLQTAGYDITKTTYRGKPSDATAKLAFFGFGQLQLELIEPDEKPSIWREFLEAKGEGAQHIAFQVHDTQWVADYFASHGIAIAQQGLYSDKSGMYTYFDSDALLGTTIETLQSF